MRTDGKLVIILLGRSNKGQLGHGTDVNSDTISSSRVFIQVTSQTACSSGSYQASTAQVSCDDADAGYYVGTWQRLPDRMLGGHLPARHGPVLLRRRRRRLLRWVNRSDIPGGMRRRHLPARHGPDGMRRRRRRLLRRLVTKHLPDGMRRRNIPARHGPVLLRRRRRRLLRRHHCLHDADGMRRRHLPARHGPVLLRRRRRRLLVDSTGQSSQTACAVGTYQAYTGSTACGDADAGHYVDSTASTSQTACSSGTYNPDTASTSSASCLDADAGYYVDDTGQSSQTACAVGTYQGSTGQSSCDDADAGYYVGGLVVTEVASGGKHTCVIVTDGSIFCWGYNWAGQLGDGTNTDSLEPVPVVMPSGVTALSITAGSTHTCAIMDDGSAYCWGSDENGQLGDATSGSGGYSGNQNTPSPVAIPTGRTVSQLDAGSAYNCAILDDGSAYCWGYKQRRARRRHSD